MTSKHVLKQPIVEKRLHVLVCVVLAAMIFGAYLQVKDHGFINFDDADYITENRHVQKGLTKEGIVWAVTATHSSNWHPLTWLSHMADCQFFGMDPGWHHLVNVVFHTINSIILFLVLVRMTGTLWRSAFVAALFAIHPLHIESVAWASERKDLLSALFWMLTIWCYLLYVEVHRPTRYIAALVFFVLGLMSKPMAVTLPFVLILLDYWPLGRLRFRSKGAINKSPATASSHSGSCLLHLIWEKTPFFVLSAASCLITFHVQQSARVVGSLESLSLLTRVGNIVVSYCCYIGKMIWPFRLAIFYPYPDSIPLGEIVGASLLLVGISVAIFWFLREHRAYTVGWLWYLGTLVPVIGLVQVGGQSMADRYTYIPLIGIFIMVAWGLHDLTKRWRTRKTILSISAALAVVFFMAMTFIQVQHWKNSITLFERALEVTRDNYVAHCNLGSGLAKNGRIDEAMEHYLETIRILPDHERAHNNLGVAYAGKGRLDEAAWHYKEALRVDPDYPKAHNNLGNLFMRQGRIDEAIKHYSEAVRIKPDFGIAHYALGNALLKRKRIDKAIAQFLIAARLRPDQELIQKRMGNVMGRLGRFDESIKHYKKALSIRPDYKEAMVGLAEIHAIKGDNKHALALFKKLALLEIDNAVASYNTACMYARLGEVEESTKWLKRAVDRGYDNWHLIRNDKDLEPVRRTACYQEILKKAKQE